VLRLDGAGNPLWQRAFGGAEHDFFWAVAAVPEGGWLLAGWTESQGSGGWDGWVMRLGGAGNPLWQRAFGGAKDDWFNAVASAPDGGWLLAGGTRSQGSGEVDGWVLKVDAEGRLNP
jgi:hypothetical protein